MPALELEVAQRMHVKRMRVRVTYRLVNTILLHECIVTVKQKEFSFDFTPVISMLFMLE